MTRLSSHHRGQPAGAGEAEREAGRRTWAEDTVQCSSGIGDLRPEFGNTRTCRRQWRAGPDA